MFETGISTSITDLFQTKLATFAVAAGWTNNHSASDRLFLTRSDGSESCSVAFRWASASPTCAGIYQHTAFVSSGTDPGNHTNDSGQGSISGTDSVIDDGRHVPLTNGTQNYWFFESDYYLHCVVETASLRYVHFGFGILNKTGTWTGGAYSYGYRHVSTALDTGGAYLLDGLTGITAAATHRPFAGTVHCESLPNQTASGKWGLTWAGLLANTSTDRGGTARENLSGGYRAGPIAEYFGRFGGSPTSGLNPMYQIGVWYDDRSQARWHPLGFMNDVRGINVKNYSGGEEVTIGSDIWIPFPARFKPSTAASSSGNAGIAYKKVTT